MKKSTKEIFIETSGELYPEIQVISEEELSVIKKKNFTGGEELLQIIVAITTFTIPIIQHFIIKKIEDRKKITIKIDGIEVDLSGMDEQKLKKILKSLKNEDKDDSKE